MRYAESVIARARARVLPRTEPAQFGMPNALVFAAPAIRTFQYRAGNSNLRALGRTAGARIFSITFRSSDGASR